MAIRIKLKGGNEWQKTLAKHLASQQAKTLQVGFLASEKYPDGTPVAMVAFWQEYGTKIAPPRPFFRPTIAAKSDEWADKLAVALQATGGKLEAALALVGEVMAGDISDAIVAVDTPALSPVTLWMRKLRGGGQDRKPFSYAMLVAARQRASAGQLPTGINTKPLQDTGQMRRSVGYRVV